MEGWSVRGLRRTDGWYRAASVGITAAGAGNVYEGGVIPSEWTEEHIKNPLAQKFCQHKLN